MMIERFKTDTMRTVLLDSIILGGQTGFTLSLLYLLFLVTVMIIGGSLSGQFLASIAAASELMIVGSLLGLLPGTMLGAITALTIALALWTWRSSLSTSRAALIGFMVCLGVVLWANSVIQPVANLISTTWWSVPWLVYLTAGSWLGAELLKKLR